MEEKLTNLGRLKALLDEGALTQEEFDREKALLLSGEAGSQRSSGGRNWTAIAVAIAVVVGAGGWLVAHLVQTPELQTKLPAAHVTASDIPAAEATTAEPEPVPVDPYVGAKLTGCRQSECSWEKVLGVRSIKTTPAGVLKLEESYQGTMMDRDGTAPTRYSLSAPIKWEKEPVQTYVFCSRSQPSVAFKDRWTPGGGWLGHLLDLYNTFGYNEPSAETYMRVCHGVRYGRKDIEKVLASLGYRAGTRNEQVDLERPVDLINPPPSANEVGE